MICLESDIFLFQKIYVSNTSVGRMVSYMDHLVRPHLVTGHNSHHTFSPGLGCVKFWVDVGFCGLFVGFEVCTHDVLGVMETWTNKKFLE